MSATNAKKVYSSFTDGLNDKLSPLLLKDKEAAELLNYEVNERGILDKYKGFIKDGAPFPDDADSFIRFLLNFKRGTSVDVLLMAAQDDGNTNTNLKVDFKKTSGDAVYSYIGHTTGTATFTNGNTGVSGNGTAWLSHLKAGDKIKVTAHADAVYQEISSVTNDTALVLTSGYTGASTGGNVAYIARIICHKGFVPRGIVFNNKAIITNGSEIAMTYDNTTLDRLTDAQAPVARYIEAHKNRVFMANTSSFNSRLFWAAVNNEASWDAAALDDIFPDDNGAIIAIKSFADSLIVLKNNGNIYQIVGNFTTALGDFDYAKKLDSTENIGIISERTPVIHDGYLYFLSETGVYRIDQRLHVEKTSYSVDTFVSGLNFSLAPSTTKTFTFDTQTEWDTGATYGAGARSTTAGQIENIYDQLTVSGRKIYRGCSVWVHTDNDVHIAYIDPSDNNLLKYKEWDYATQAETTETAVNILTSTALAPAGSKVVQASICKAANGRIGIAYLFYHTGSNSYEGRFAERTGVATWTDEAIAGIGTPSSSTAAEGCVSLRYQTDSVPVVTLGFIQDRINNYKHTSLNNWSTREVESASGLSIWDCSLNINASNHYFVSFYDRQNGRIRAYTNTDQHASGFSLIESLTSLDAATRKIQSVLNSSNQLVTYFSQTDAVKKRNHTTTTTTNIDTNSGATLIGATLDAADLDYVYLATGSSPSVAEKFYYEGVTTNFSNSSTNVVEASASVAVGDKGMHNNGIVMATVSWGANANEIIVRRLAFRAVYTTPEKTDSTLTAWGTYEVSDLTENSATVTHEIALNTASPASSFNTVVPGSLISTNASNVYIKNRITMVLGAFAKPSLGKIVDNYTAPGVDAKQAVAASFDNQLYIACARNSSTENDRVLALDIGESFYKTSYPVSSMERFKKKLYAGRSTNGDLLILRQGYSFADVAYSSDFQSKEDFLDSVELEKDIYKVYVLYEVKSTGTFTFSYRLDNYMTPGGATWQDKTVDQTTTASTPGIYEVGGIGKARSIQFRAQNTTVDNQNSIIAIIVVYGYLSIR